MTRRGSLVLIWFAACVIAVIVGLGLLSVMVPGDEVSWATRIPRRAITVPMICVIVFWGVVRASGVHLSPVPTFTFGGVAVYLALFVIGRILVSVAINPTLVLMLVLAILMSLGWIAVHGAARRMPRKPDI